MFKKSFFLFVLFSVLATSAFAFPISEGFLGISFSPSLSSTKTVSSETVQKNRFLLPLDFIGASEEYDIVSKMVLISDINNAASYFSGNDDFLVDNESYWFSFFNMSVAYRVGQFKDFTFLGGFNFGHSGTLLAGSTANFFNFYIAPELSAYWFMSKHIALYDNFRLYVPVYRKNMHSSVYLENTFELILDPIGPIANPVSDSAFYALGLFVHYSEITTNQSILVKTLELRPYFKFTLLY